MTQQSTNWSGYPYLTPLILTACACALQEHSAVGGHGHPAQLGQAMRLGGSPRPLEQQAQQAGKGELSRCQDLDEACRCGPACSWCSNSFCCRSKDIVGQRMLLVMIRTLQYTNGGRTAGGTEPRQIPVTHYFCLRLFNCRLSRNLLRCCVWCTR